MILGFDVKQTTLWSLADYSMLVGLGLLDFKNC